MSTKLEITSSFAAESDTAKIGAPETLLLAVIELDFTESDTLLPEIIQPKVPQPSSPTTSRPSSSLPLSQTQPQIAYLGPDGEPLPPGLMSLKEVPQEEPHPSSLVHCSGLHFYQNYPLPPPQTPTQTPLPNSFPFKSPISFLWKYYLGHLTMTESSMISESVSTTMVETTNVDFSSMFAT